MALQMNEQAQPSVCGLPVMDAVQALLACAAMPPSCVQTTRQQPSSGRRRTHTRYVRSWWLPLRWSWHIMMQQHWMHTNHTMVFKPTDWRWHSSSGVPGGPG